MPEGSALAPPDVPLPTEALRVCGFVFLATGLGYLPSAATTRHLTVAAAPVTRQNKANAMETGT